MKDKYILLRNLYIPKKIRLVFVLESPPQGHGYFYDSTGRVSEVLFRAFMKLIKFTPKDKEEGLIQLANKGILLVNPIYIPVNKLSEKEADLLIMKNYDLFIKDLVSLGISNKTPIILVKKNILRLLEKKLLVDRFNVINGNLLIPFPLHYHINTFISRCALLMSKVGM